MSTFWIVKFEELFRREVTDGYESYTIVGKERTKQKAKKVADKYQKIYDKKEKKHESAEYLVREQTDPKSKYIAFIYDSAFNYYNTEFWEQNPPDNWKEVTDNDYEKKLSGYSVDYSELIKYKNKKGKEEILWATSLPLKVTKDVDIEETNTKTQSKIYKKEKHNKNKKEGYEYRYSVILVQDTQWHGVYGPPGEDFIKPYFKNIQKEIINPIINKLLRTKTISKVKIVEDNKDLIFFSWYITSIHSKYTQEMNVKYKNLLSKLIKEYKVPGDYNHNIYFDILDVEEEIADEIYHKLEEKGINILMYEGTVDIMYKIDKIQIDPNSTSDNPSFVITLKKE